MATKELVAYSSPNSMVSEQYRTIRANLHFSDVEQRSHTLVITSPGKKEGKTTTVSNLAVSMAQNGDRVLLIDADLRKPSIHSFFQKDNEVGLTQVIHGRSSLQEAICSTDITGLDVLTSGSIPFNPAELLGSPNMQKVIEEAVFLYDVVLFDTSPVLDVTDARVLAHQCDGVILVLCQDKTEMQEAVEAKRLLELARVKLKGVVFNKKF